MEDVFGPLVVVLAGAIVNAAGYLPFRETLRRVRRGRTWPRTTAYVTRAWTVSHTSAGVARATPGSAVNPAGARRESPTACRRPY